MEILHVSVESLKLQKSVGTRSALGVRHGCHDMVLGSLIWSWSELNRFGPIWTDLDQFGPIWTDLDQFEPIWTNLDQFGPILTNSDPFGLIMTNLEPFGAI